MKSPYKSHMLEQTEVIYQTYSFFTANNENVFFLFVLTMIGFYLGCLTPSVIQSGEWHSCSLRWRIFIPLNNKMEGGQILRNAAVMLEIPSGLSSSACFLYK